MCDEVTTLLRVEKLGVKLSLGRKEGQGEMFLGFLFCSCYPTLINSKPISLS